MLCYSFDQEFSASLKLRLTLNIGQSCPLLLSFVGETCQVTKLQPVHAFYSRSHPLSLNIRVFCFPPNNPTHSTQNPCGHFALILPQAKGHLLPFRGLGWHGGLHGAVVPCPCPPPGRVDVARKQQQPPRPSALCLWEPIQSGILCSLEKQKNTPGKAPV